jgi:hypothetical protein
MQMEKKFTLEVEMEERWIPHFMSMLKYAEHLGKIGASRSVAIYADGDGDFRPKFKADIDFESVEPTKDHEGARIYDAG